MAIHGPELVGRGGWINSPPLSLADLRGRFVLLDFWTYCCINCLHVLDELRPVEEEFADSLVVIGVHSPKFVHEADHASVVAAVERYGVEHPVLDDPDLATWRAYAVKAWPTLVLLDPTGRIVWTGSGEGHAHALTARLRQLTAEHEAAGTLVRGDGPFQAPPPAATELRFPAKAVAGTEGIWIADAGHHSLALLDDAGGVVRRIGDGQRGHADGSAAEARFNEPNGLCLLPVAIAGKVGYDLVVADTVNHRIRGIDTASGEVRTIAGDGRQWMQGDTTGSLSSPWDVAWFDDRIWIAMAGIHQLWTLDPRTGAVAVVAGTSNEGLRDGTAADAWLAQPSGLTVGTDRLWFADSETSALRWLRRDGDSYVVGTAIGRGLFDFGHRDGPAADALLQHPLGVTALADGRIAIADTYNGAVRIYDPATAHVATAATGLAEPSGLIEAGGRLLVVESAAHRLIPIDLDTIVKIGGDAHRTQRPPTDVSATIDLEVVFTPPPGQHLDERFGPATRLIVTATPPQLLREGEGRDTGLVRRLELNPEVGDGVLHVAATAASCDDHDESAACHMHQQDWGIPVRITTDGTANLTIPLSG